MSAPGLFGGNTGDLPIASPGAPPTSSSSSSHAMINRLGKQLSIGTQQLAQQAVSVAQAAGASLVAGLRTCDERSGSTNDLHQYEIRIANGGTVIESSATSRCRQAAVTAEMNVAPSGGRDTRENQRNGPRGGCANGLLSSLLGGTVGLRTPQFLLAARPGTAPPQGVATTGLALAPALTAATGTAIAGPFLVDIWGSHNFDFNVQLMQSGNHAGCLVATATHKPSRDGSSFPAAGPNSVVPSTEATSSGRPLQIRCKWKRRIAGHIFEVAPPNSTTVYQVSADDVCSSVLVEATSLDSHSTGTAYGEIGVFELDASTRRNLDNYLALGHTRFKVRSQWGSGGAVERSPGLTSEPENTRSSSHHDATADLLTDEFYDVRATDELMLLVSFDEVKLLKPGPKNLGFVNDWSSRFGGDFPRIDLNTRSSTAFTLHLGPETLDTFRLHAMTRSQRDLITLTLRCFHGRQWTTTSALLQQVGMAATQGSMKLLQQDQSLESTSNYASRQGQGSTGSSELTLPSDESQGGGGWAMGYSLLLIQRLCAELYSCLDKAEKSLKERDRAQTEKAALEEDTWATIEAYQNLLAKFSPDDKKPVLGGASGTKQLTLDISQRAAYTADLESKLRESKTQCEKFVTELDLLRKDYRRLEDQLSSSGVSAMHRTLPPQNLQHSMASPLPIRTSLNRAERSPGSRDTNKVNVASFRSPPTRESSEFALFLEQRHPGSRDLLNSTDDLSRLFKQQSNGAKSGFQTSSKLWHARGRESPSATRSGFRIDRNLQDSGGLSATYGAGTAETAELRRHLEELHAAHAQLLEQTEMQDKELERMRLLVTDADCRAAGTASNSILNGQSGIGTTRLLETATICREEHNALKQQHGQLQKDYDELRESFLYMKSKYDALAAAQAVSEMSNKATVSDQRRGDNGSTDTTTAGASSSPTPVDNNSPNRDRIRELEAQVEEVRATLLAASTEKNRLVKQNEALSRDLEKSRRQSEAMMTLNTKISQDKSAAEDRARKMEHTLAEQHKTVQSLEASLEPLKSMDELKRIIAQQDEQIEKLKMEKQELEKEVNSLRSRLRKIATTQ